MWERGGREERKQSSINGNFWPGLGSEGRANKSIWATTGGERGVEGGGLLQTNHIKNNSSIVEIMKVDL